MMDSRNGKMNKRPSEPQKADPSRNSEYISKAGSADMEYSQGRRTPAQDEALRQRRKQALLRKKRRHALIRRRCLAVVSVITFIAAIAMIANYVSTMKQENQVHRTQQELLDMFTAKAVTQDTNGSTDDEVPENESTPIAEPTEYIEQEIQNIEELNEDLLIKYDQVYDAPIEETEIVISDRFVELVNINPDIVGWIMAGSEISTPVVLRDNDYYLDHDFYGENSVAGTVFIDELCDKWDIEQYKIFYGHNMKNDSMFGKLDEYMDLAYLKENLSFEYHSVYNNEITYYVPIAVIDASMDKEDEKYFFLRRFDIFREPRDESAIEKFIAELQERSMYTFDGVDVTADDNILCLVTCTYELSDARLMVFCRELRDGENLDEMVQLVQDNVEKNDPE